MRPDWAGGCVMLPMKRLVLLFGAAALMAGCATTANLRSAADRLEQRAEDLTHEVRAADERHDYRREAVAFADESRDFRHVVAERGGDSRDVREAFHDLSSRYHALRDAAGD